MKPIYKLTFALLLGASTLSAQKTEVTVKNLEEVNSEYLDMHAMPFGDDLIITTGRNRNMLICEDPDLQGEPYTDLYFAKAKGQMQYETPEIIAGDMRINYHDAVPSIHPNGRTAVFTRSFVGDPELKVLHLFSAEYVDGSWTNVKSVPFNNDDYSNLHPAWSPDGKTLYYSSNQGTADEKDYNLFKIDYNEGNWGVPQVLNGAINTKKTEYFPFMDENGRLYFASNGHKGYGGLDIYFSEMSNGTWSQPEALPKPINSGSDDHAYVALPGGKKGFLSSNRPKGKGSDDIYTWAINEEPMDIKLIVINKENQIQLGDAEVEIEPILEKIPNSFFLDKKQLKAVNMQSKVKKPLTYETVPSGMYRIKVNKAGFQPLDLTVSAEELAKNEVYNLPIVPIRVLKTFEATVLNVQTLEPIKNSKVTLIGKTDGSVQELMTNAKGMVTGRVDCEQDYEVKADKEGFVGDMLKLSCDDNSPEPIKATLKLAPPVKEGLVIVLENVYYDFDKHFIRPDAAIELDKVVRLMERYPSMKIELGSHTDVRGNDEYNRNLSQRRATAAVEYIISKGIGSNRIVAQGYGETQLVNRCSNGVQCNEEEHQQNRRTEIKVTELNEKDVKVTYKN